MTKCNECGAKAEVNVSWMVHQYSMTGKSEDMVESDLCFKCGKELEEKMAPTTKMSLIYKLV